MRTTPLVVLGCLLVACGDDSARSGGDTNAPSDSTPSDTSIDTSSDAPDTSTPSATPLVERAGTLSYTCSEKLAPTQTDPNDWFTLAAFSVDGEPWVLRVEGFQTEITIAPVGDDATVGASVPVATIASGATRGAAWSDGTRVTAVWSELDGEVGGQYLMSAVVDRVSGVLVSGPVALTENSPAIGGPVLAKSGDVLAMVWSETNDDGSTLRFAELAADGLGTGGAVSVASTPVSYQGLDPSLVALGDGFAVSWSQPTESLSDFEVYFARLDRAGTKVG